MRTPKSGSSVRQLIARAIGVSCLFAAAISNAALAQSAATPSQRRVALIIGNAHYVGASPLDNPGNDAEDMCSALRSLKFEVACFRDVATRREFKDHLIEFARKLSGDTNTVGMFYYAGHGLQIDGENYLIPTRADIRAKEDVEDESVSLNFVMEALDNAHNAINLVVLDACRDNPFRGFTRSMTRGLAEPQQFVPGTILIYSTRANTQAYDGSGRNSPFARGLLKHIGDPVPVETMIKRVTREVQSETASGGGKPQEPAVYYQSFTGEFCFANCESAPDATDVDRRRQASAELSRLAKESEDRKLEIERLRHEMTRIEVDRGKASQSTEGLEQSQREVRKMQAELADKEEAERRVRQQLEAAYLTIRELEDRIADRNERPRSSAPKGGSRTDAPASGSSETPFNPPPSF